MPAWIRFIDHIKFCAVQVGCIFINLKIVIVLVGAKSKTNTGDNLLIIFLIQKPNFKSPLCLQCSELEMHRLSIYPWKLFLPKGILSIEKYPYLSSFRWLDWLDHLENRFPLTLKWIKLVHIWIFFIKYHIY